MKTYKVNEIFYSLQGEGSHAGHPAVFVRFSGCNLKCPWCDTEHETGVEMTAKQIHDETRLVAGRSSRPDVPILLVFTGGEPMMHLDGAGMERMTAGWIGQVCIETNGTIDCRWRHRVNREVWFTVSPKEGNPVRLAASLISELKVVLTETTDPEQVLAEVFSVLPRPHGLSCYIQAQWVEGDDPGCCRNHLRAVDYVKAHPVWRLSVQTQRFLAIK